MWDVTSCECDSAQSLRALTCSYSSPKHFCNVFILVVGSCLCGLRFHGTTSGQSVHFYRKTPGLSGRTYVHSAPPPNLSDPINNKNNIWKVTQPKILWDICHQLSRKCVSASLDCCTLSTSLETERLAGSVIQIYMDVTLLSECQPAHMRIEYIYCVTSTRKTKQNTMMLCWVNWSSVQGVLISCTLVTRRKQPVEEQWRYS